MSVANNKRSSAASEVQMSAARGPSSKQQKTERVSRKSRKSPVGPGFVHVVRWSRVTECDEYDWENLKEAEGPDDLAMQCVQDELDSIDGLSTDVGAPGTGAFSTVEEALTVRNSTLAWLVEQAQTGVQEALGCNTATFSRLKKKDWIVEYCDAKFHDGPDTAVDLKQLGVPMEPPNPSRDEEESNWWWRRSSQRLRDSIAHQVDYAMYWGATSDAEPGCKVSDLIGCTDCNTTHVRVWIESMPLASSGRAVTEE